MAGYVNAPLEEIAREVQELIDQGHEIHQKFTCEACGERVTVVESNQIFSHGRHDDCPVEDGHITDLRVIGCNFLAIKANRHGIPFDGQRRGSV
jgi:hypothetical protein